MGAGASGGRGGNAPAQQRWYECGKWIPKDLLNEDERGRLSLIWEASIKNRSAPHDALFQMCTSRCCSKNQVSFICWIINDDTLGLESALRLVGLMSKGSEQDKRRLWFECVDRDGNGTLDIEELETAVRLIAPATDKPYQKSAARQLMIAGDKDGNGVLSLDEWQVAHKQLARKLDEASQESRKRARLHAQELREKEQAEASKAARAAAYVPSGDRFGGNIRDLMPDTGQMAPTLPSLVLPQYKEPKHKSRPLPVAAAAERAMTAGAPQRGREGPLLGKSAPGKSAAHPLPEARHMTRIGDVKRSGKWFSGAAAQGAQQWPAAGPALVEPPACGGDRKRNAKQALSQFAFPAQR